MNFEESMRAKPLCAQGRLDTPKRAGLAASVDEAVAAGTSAACVSKGAGADAARKGRVGIKRSFTGGRGCVGSILFH